MNQERIASKDLLRHEAYVAAEQAKEKWSDADRERYDKIAGCLLAGALGDALGYTVEFCSWSEIRREFGEQGIQRPVPGVSGKLEISDDTQMTLFTCEGIANGTVRALSRGIAADVWIYIYYSYLSWLKTQGRSREVPWDRDDASLLLKITEMNARRAPGVTCLNALGSGEMGTIEKPLNSSKGCGGVMRTAPLGFTDRWGDVMVNGAQAAALTHGHPGGWIPAGMLSDIVYRIVYEEKKDLKEIVLASMDKAEKLWGDRAECTEFLELMERALELAASEKTDREAIDLLSAKPWKGGGWTGDEALAIAVLCCLRHPDNIEECLRAAVNHSGDSDSTGAIAGNILGAYLGKKSIPSEWLAELELAEALEYYATVMTDMVNWEYE